MVKQQAPNCIVDNDRASHWISRGWQWKIRCRRRETPENVKQGPIRRCIKYDNFIYATGNVEELTAQVLKEEVGLEAVVRSLETDKSP